MTYEELMNLVKENKTWKRKPSFTAHDTSRPKGVEITDAKTGGQYVLTGYIWPEFTAEVRGAIGPLKKSAQRKVRVVIRREAKPTCRLTRGR